MRRPARTTTQHHPEEEFTVSVITVPQAFNEEDLYVDVEAVFGQSLLLKCEGFNFASTDQAEGGRRDGGLGRTRRHAPGRLRPRRVLVREPGRRTEHDRGQQGLPLHLCDGLTLQPGHAADDGGTGQRSAPGGRRGVQRRLPRRASGPCPAAVRLRRPVRVAEPVLQPRQLEGALPHDGSGDRPLLPPAGRPVHGRGDHGDPDGLRAVVPGLAPPRPDRRGGHHAARWRSAEYPAAG